MVQVTDATFSGGVLRPDNTLDLKDQQRVRVIVQAITPAVETDRARAVEELRAGIASMKFRSNGAYPTRDELHDRP
jgi:predicted DNA-binding antitoxin AbrB/MazE fold protein